MRVLAPLWIVVVALGLPVPPVVAMPIEAFICAPNRDGSAVELRVISDGSEQVRCSFSCHVKPAGQSFMGWTCDATVSAIAKEQLLCTLEGDGPGAFVDADMNNAVCT